MPASQLVKFFENKTYQCDKKTNTVQGDDSESDLSVQMDLSDDDDYIPDNSDSPSHHQKCQRMQSFQSQESMTTSTPKKSKKSVSSQIIIISSKELPHSSDESSTIDAGTDEIIFGAGKLNTNPWCDMDVKDIPIEIVNDLHEHDSNRDDTVMYELTPSSSFVFNPLCDEDRRIAVMKFNLVIKGKSHPVNFSGLGNFCPCPPTIHHKAKANGTCLFNAFSMLLTGRDMYSAIIWHVTCNYIANPIKFKNLRAYLPTQFKCG